MEVWESRGEWEWRWGWGLGVGTKENIKLLGNEVFFRMQRGNNENAYTSTSKFRPRLFLNIWTVWASSVPNFVLIALNKHREYMLKLDVLKFYLSLLCFQLFTIFNLDVLIKICMVKFCPLTPPGKFLFLSIFSWPW